MNFIVVFLGAGIGGAARHGVNLIGMKMTDMYGHPIATLLVNVAGSFLMGVAGYYFSNDVARGAPLDTSMRLFLTTGVLGGFTTFSSFSLDLAGLIESGKIGLGVAYAIASVLLSLIALLLGLATARAAIN